MTRFSTKTVLMAAALVAAALAAPHIRICAGRGADALGAEAGHGLRLRQGRQDLSYKMGTNNAGMLLKGAKKVPKGTLFFIGQNGQLYMRTGPYLEGDGKFMFGSN